MLREVFKHRPWRIIANPTPRPIGQTIPNSAPGATEDCGTRESTHLSSLQEGGPKELEEVEDRNADLTNQTRLIGDCSCPRYLYLINTHINTRASAFTFCFLIFALRFLRRNAIGATSWMEFRVRMTRMRTSKTMLKGGRSSSRTGSGSRTRVALATAIHNLCERLEKMIR